MQRILLILPSETYRAKAFLDAAQNIGAEIIIAFDKNQPMSPLMGNRALELDFCSPEQSLTLVKKSHNKNKFDSIVAVDEQSVELAAFFANNLGLRYSSVGSVALTRNKAQMRKAFAAHNVPQANFKIINTVDDIVQSSKEIGFPCVVKPTTLSGSRGVIRIDNKEQAQQATITLSNILTSLQSQPNSEILIETYLPGKEVAVEAIIERGNLHILAIFDKPDPLEGPYFEETIYVTPSRLDEKTQEAIKTACELGCAALGLDEGPIHAELRVQPQKAWVIEVASRSIGGLCSQSLSFGPGMTLEEIILRHALGMDLTNTQREKLSSGVMMLPIRQKGILKEVKNQEKALQIPQITGLQISILPGKKVIPLPEGDRYLGFLFAKGSSPDQVETALRKAHAELEVIIEDQE